MKVLITGAGGFTSKYLKAILVDSGYEVIELFQGSYEIINYQTARCDIKQLEEISKIIQFFKPDFVVHLAAISFVGFKSPDEFYNTNIIGTRNLLESLKVANFPIKQLIVASSANVYGNQENKNITELIELRPENDYAVSKVAVEYLCKCYIKYLPILITRPFNYSGIGQSDSFLIPKIVNHFKSRSKEISLGNIDIYRDFSDVRDVVFSYKKIIQLNDIHSGDIVNIASGKVISLMEIISYCEEITGYSIKVVKDPKFVRDNEIKYLGGSRLKLDQIIGKSKLIEFRQTLQWMLS